MKKSTIVIFFIFAFLQTQAQDYLISFACTGGSTTVDSVQVRNLTQNTSLTLHGIDVLHLMLVFGINPAIESINGNLFIYPNPIKESGFVDFETALPGIATLEVCDITGKQIAQTQINLPAGQHTFSLSGLNGGMYTLSISSPAYGYTGKIACTRVGGGNPKINYVSSQVISASQNKLKRLQSVVPMQYNNGDQLLFTCFSGIYSAVIPMVPYQSQTVTGNFIACTDANGNNYATVTIGTQTWMAENLNVGIRIDGIQDQTNNSIIEKYCYNNNQANCAIYGGLYQWDEMMQYVTTPGVQGICPTGWHIPTDGEWITLTNFLGGEFFAGGKIKSTGTIQYGTGLWTIPNFGATNESGFTAFPAGCYTGDGSFWGVSYYGFFWSSSDTTSTNAWCRNLECEFNSIGRPFQGSGKVLGFSVRCLKDY